MNDMQEFKEYQEFKKMKQEKKRDDKMIDPKAEPEKAKDDWTSKIFPGIKNPLIRYIALSLIGLLILALFVKVLQVVL